MKKIGIILIIIFSVVLIFFISVVIGANISSKEINEKKQETETIEKNEETKETEESKQIKCEYIGIDANADKETLKKYMKQYDENTYLLSIRDIETFENTENMLEMKYKNNDDSRIDKDTFERYSCDVLLIFIENKNKVGVQNVLAYKEKIVINFSDDEIDMSMKEKQMFCILISKADNKENIEFSYSRSNRIEEEQNKEKVNFKPCYIDDVKEFDSANLTYNDSEEIYYTEFLDTKSYKELSDKLKINTTTEISDDDIAEKDIAVIFKKTNKKIKMKNIKEEASLLNVELTEADEEYGKGITGMIIITKKGKYSTYKAYIK